MNQHIKAYFHWRMLVKAGLGVFAAWVFYSGFQVVFSSVADWLGGLL